MRSREHDEDGVIPLRRHPAAWAAAVVGAAFGALARWTTSAAVADRANLAVSVARGFAETGGVTDPSTPGPVSPLHTALLVAGGELLAVSAGIGDGPGLRQVVLSELEQRPLATVVGLVLVAVGAAGPPVRPRGSPAHPRGPTAR